MGIIVADTASASDVQTAINASSNGDTVIIPSGTPTWTTQVTCSKNIRIVGAGESNTVITMSSSIGSYTGGLYITATGYYDVSEMKIISTGTTVYPIMTYGVTSAFRIHNMTMEGYKTMFNAFSYGLVDHCTFNNCGEAIDVRFRHPSDSVLQGDYSWTLGSSLGTANNLFIEDCTFNYTATGTAFHAITSVNGARTVFRYNTMSCDSDSSCNMDVHGNFYNDRSAYSYEFYENTLTNAHQYLSNAFNIRGGSGVIYNNTITNTGSGTVLSDIYLQQYKVWYVSASNPTWTQTDIDNETYPSDDQINNLYIWNNEKDLSPASIVVNPADRNSEFIQLDRDYFDEALGGYTAYTYPHPLQTYGEVYIAFTV